MKALVVRLSSIGDVVHTLPALAALHRSACEVGWIVAPAARPLLEGHPLLSSLVALPARPGPSALLAARRRLRGEAYEAALDFQGLWKSALWARSSGARRVIGYAARWRREPASGVLVRERQELPPAAVHVIDKNLALLRPLGIDALGLREFPLPRLEAAARAVAGQLAAARIERFAILNPGGGWASKLWPAERYGGVARALAQRALTPLVTWGPGEQALADRVVAASERAALRCFPTSLTEYVELARRASVVVAADTGPLHLACAVGTPVVALFGPTDPARNGPFAAADVTLRRAPACAPCHKRDCRVHDGVMDAIATDEVVEAIGTRLARAARPTALAF
jgi:ADP-heptose:LPS heptosyltransferase